MHPPKTIVITGANRGIGLALTSFYAEQATVTRIVAVYRSQSDDLNALKAKHEDKITTVQVKDLAVEEEVVKIVPQLRSAGIDQVDLLINNAAINLRSNLPELGQAELEKVLSVNVAGPHLVTREFLPLITPKTGVVCFISSKLGSSAVASPPHGDVLPAYRISKAAENMLMRVYFYTNPDISWISICPGWTDTDMGSASGKYNPVLTPAQSASNVAGVLAQLGSKYESGSFIGSHQGEPFVF